MDSALNGLQEIAGDWKSAALASLLPPLGRGLRALSRMPVGALSFGWPRFAPFAISLRKMAPLFGLGSLALAGVGCSRKEEAPASASSANSAPRAVPTRSESPPPPSAVPSGVAGAFPQPSVEREGDAAVGTLHWISQEHHEMNPEMPGCAEAYADLVMRDTLRVQLGIRNFLKARGARVVFLENYTPEDYEALASRLAGDPDLSGRLRALPALAGIERLFGPYQNDPALLQFYYENGGAAAYALEQNTPGLAVPIEDRQVVARASRLLRSLGGAAFQNPEMMGLMRDRELRGFHLLNEYATRSAIPSRDFYFVMGAAHALRGGSAQYSGRGDLVDEAEVKRFRGRILRYEFYDAESRRIEALQSRYCRSR